jgi:xylose isomerase
MSGIYRFSFGPWNIHEGSDPFGSAVRKSIKFNEKLRLYKKLGFDGVQFHDDDAVPNLNNLMPQQITDQAKQLKKVLDCMSSDQFSPFMLKS